MRNHRLIKPHFSGFLALLFAITATADELSLELNLDREYYLDYTEQQIYAQATIQTPALQNEAEKQLQLNLCFVVDRSGSMAGDLIEHTKKALADSFETLSQNDILSLVVFGSEVETLIEAQRADQLSNIAPLIESIEPIGGTALYDAINQGAAQLRRYRNANTVNRMIIISDGAPNKGPREIEDFTKIAELFAGENVSISTIGLGEVFSEDLLTQLATVSGGNFYYVPTGEALGQAIKEDLHPLSQIIARDIILTLEFSHHLKVDEYLGKEPEVKHRTVTYHWNELASNSKVQTLITAELSASGSSFFSNRFIKGNLSFLPASNNFTERLTVYSNAEGKWTTSKDASVDSRNTELYRYALSLEIGKSIKEAIEFSDNGKPEKGLRKIKRTLSDLKWINYTLDDDVVDIQIQELQSTYDKLKAEGLNRIDRKALTAQVANLESIYSDNEQEPSEQK